MALLLRLGVFLWKKLVIEVIIIIWKGCDLFMEVNMIILPKNNSDINLEMKKQIKHLFEKLFNNVNDSAFEINLDNNVKIEY